jgi:PKD repeat protein
MYHLFKNKKNSAGIFLFFFFVAMISADTRAYIYTPYGSLVPATWYTDEQYTRADKIAITNEYAASFPNATILNYYWPGEQYTPTTTYNCHGFAWHMKEFTDGYNHKVWIGVGTSDAEDIYWNDGSYIRVYNQSQATKVSWPSDINHSGITTGTTNVFISKWGADVLARHHKDDCPFATSRTLKYYRKRNASVQANFTYSRLTDYKVQFTDQSTATDCSIINRTWTFGDGATSSETNPVHVYSQSGNYNVSLIVEGNYNAGTSTDSDTISIGSLQDFVITNPEGGEVWEIGKTYKVEWNPNNGISGNLRMNLLQYNQYKGMLFGTIANDGDKDWTIDEYKGGEPIVPGSNFQIQLVSKVDPSIKTKSGYFTIVQ